MIERIILTLRHLNLQLIGRRIVYSIIIGLIAGLGGILFFTASHIAIHYCLGFIIGYTPPSPGGETFHLPEFNRPLHRWLFLIVPTIGGLLSGIVVYRFAPEAEGHGTDAVIDSFHQRGGRIRGRVPIVKTIASVLTLGSGGSGGREGPIAQIGAGFGAFLADRLKLSDGERRLMTIAGLAGGIGSIFKSPLAGAIFGCEVLYREEDIEPEALIPATVASITGYSLFASVFGWTPLFRAPNFTFSHPIELLPYATLGLLCALVGFVYIKFFEGVHDFAHRIQIPNFIKPAIGGLLTGGIGFFWPQAIGLGYGYIQNALDNPVTPLFLLVTIVVGKIAATSFSIASGGSAGVFGPSVVIGGALGGVVGGLWHQWFPQIVVSPGAFVLVGMAGFFAGVASTPISTVIMVSELTGNYNLLAPLMWVCTISFLLLRHRGIYSKQVPNRLASPAHQSEFIVSALEVLQVGEWMTKNVVSIPEQMRVKQIAEYVHKAMHAHYPVLTHKAELVGVISLKNILQAFYEEPTRQGQIAKAIANLNPVTITPEQNLSEALSIINSHHSDFLPVVESPGSKRLVGVLSRQDLSTAYDYITEKAKGAKTTPRIEPSAMERILVRDLIRTEYDAVSELTTLSQIIELEENSSTIDYPVIDSKGDFAGMLQFQAFRSVLSQNVVYPLVIAKDLLTTDVEPLLPTDTLSEALDKFGRHDFDCLPVMDLKNPRKAIGIVRRSDLMERYRQAGSALQRTSAS
ncbi:chloride channel protein [Candidatus Poribacteria bacterium]|nr:chloride channel protein [Candidatus Poribacteria bacterium]